MHIPEEIFLIIISFCNPKDCILKLTLVNKELSKLVNSEEYWKKLNEKIFHTENIQNFIKKLYKKNNNHQSLQCLYLNTSNLFH